MWILLASFIVGTADAGVRCLTPSLLPTMAPARPVQGAARMLDGKSTRDSYGVPHQAESDNFVVRWGDTGAVSTASVVALLDAFELSWQVEVDEMGHPAPETTDSTKINVYIGDTAGGTPSANGAAGYFTPDGAGYPMIVISLDSLNSGDSGHLTAAHEFYHAIQWSIGSYDYSDSALGSWYWEATASWIEVEVFPENMDYATFMGAFALLPHLPLDFFDYPDTGALTEYHQYGALIFPRYLAEFEADPLLIRDTWVDPAGGTRDPLEAIAAELEAAGGSLGETFTMFAAHNATWDYAHQQVYQDVVEYWGWSFPDEDDGIADSYTVKPDLDSGWRSVADERLPGRYGYNVVQLDVRQVGEVELELTADAVGSLGSDASWGVTLVRDHGDVVEYVPVDLEVGTDEHAVLLEVDGEGAPGLWLVVGAWTDARQVNETFGWSYRVEGRPVDLGDYDGEQLETGGPGGSRDGETSGACSAVPGGPIGAVGWGLLGCLGAVGWRRR